MADDLIFTRISMWGILYQFLLLSLCKTFVESKLRLYKQIDDQILNIYITRRTIKFMEWIRTAYSKPINNIREEFEKTG